MTYTKSLSVYVKPEDELDTIRDIRTHARSYNATVLPKITSYLDDAEAPEKHELKIVYSGPRNMRIDIDRAYDGMIIFLSQNELEIHGRLPKVPDIFHLRRGLNNLMIHGRWTRAITE